MTLKQRTLRNLCAAFGQRGVTAILGLAAHIFFARSLTPLDFGVVGVCLVAANVLERVAEAASARR